MLVIDDDAEISNVLVDLLRGRGYEVAAASSGEEGLVLVAKTPPNIVILDVHLPDVTGPRLLPRISALSPDTEVILMSGDATIDSAIEALRKHAYDYITKPFKFSQLVSSLEGALEHQRLQIENRRMLDQLKFLNNLIVQVSRSTDLDTVLKQLLSLSMTHFRAESGAVYLRAQDAWRLRQSSGVSRKFLDEFSILPSSHSLAREAEKGIVSFANAGNGTGASSLASVPLTHDDRPVGIMVLTAKSGRFFAEEDRRLLTIVGAQAGATILRTTSFQTGEERRMFLEGMIDNAADAVITYSLDGSVTGWNLAATRLYGYGEKEALGRHLLMIPEEEREGAKAIMARVALGEQIPPQEATRMRRNGQPVDVDVAFSPIKDTSGRVLAIASFSRERRTCMTPALTESAVPEKGEAQDRLREILASLVPTTFLAEGGELHARILPLPSKVAVELREAYLGKEVAATPEEAAAGIVKLFKDLGGDFEARSTPREIVITGRLCPWRNDMRHSPTACALTKALALALAQGVWPEARVVLAESLANNDKRCLILVRGPPS